MGSDPYVNAQIGLDRGGKSFLLRKGDEVQAQVVDRQMPLPPPIISSYLVSMTHVFSLEFWKPPVELEKDITS